MAAPVQPPAIRPLDGITVLTLEHAIAAPFATRQLADLGARVIKIERPGVGDFARSYDDRVNGLASHFVWTNRSKESLALDVKHALAAEILRKLLAKSDVLVQNLAPGAAARLGLSFDDLKAENPRLIVCNISGYGEDGPDRDRKAYDLLIQSRGRISFRYRHTGRTQQSRLLDRRHIGGHVRLFGHPCCTHPARNDGHGLFDRRVDAGNND